AAVVAKGWSSYLGTVFGFAGGITEVFGQQVDWGALIIIAFVTLILAMGTKLSAGVSLAITAVKVAVVLFVVILGAFYIKTENFSPFVPPAETGEGSGSGAEQSLFSLLTGAEGSSYGWYGLLAGASIVFFAFIGFDIVATTAEETKNPQRDVPRGILASLAIVTVLYVAVAVVLTGMVNYTELRDAETQNLATAFSLNGIDWAAKVISIGALAGLTTVVIVLVLGQTRVLFAMSRDGLMPRQLAKTGEHGTPVRITLIVGAVVAVTATVFPIGKLEEMVNIGTLFAFVLVSAGVIVLRRNRPDLKRGFRTPWVPVLPILSIIACVWLMLNLTGLTWLRFGIWMALGVVVYFAYGRRHSLVARRAAE
ncbi:amino acid permease, partial [Mycobacterium sp. ITM-2017-0098]